MAKWKVLRIEKRSGNKMDLDYTYFSGVEDGISSAFEKLAEVFEYQVFELCVGEEYLIPYMMNDAVENYLILKGCQMTGSYLRDDALEVSGKLAIEEDRYVLSVRQGEENAFTLCFQELEEKIQCFQYHRIGHFWVEGQEHWRQLVYIIGTIYEKYSYLGERYCNEGEKALMRLVEFPPFRMWSPVHESLEDKYPATYEGIDCMERLARKADDRGYIKWIRLYRRFPSRVLERLLGRRLLSPKRQKLYETICQEVQAASEIYPQRDYGEELNCRIQKKRTEIHAKMLEDGFEGMYPEYYKKQMQITVTEEHPFTVSMLEFENFVFRVHFMVSKCGKHVKIRKNCGFFRGLGRIGKVEREEK